MTERPDERRLPALPPNGWTRFVRLSSREGAAFDKRTAVHAWLAAATLVLGTAVWLALTPRHPSVDRTDRTEGLVRMEGAVRTDRDRSVTADVLAEALASDVPDRLTMSDDLDFFGNRLAERGPEDVLALRRLVSASLLRFQAYGKADDLARAEKHLETLTDRYPASSSLWATVASARMSRHDFSGAVQASERSVRVSGPDDSGARLGLFDAYFATGQYERARDLLGLPFDRGSFAYRIRAVRLQDRLGDVGGAREGMEAVLGIARAYAQPPVIIAWCLVELGHFEHHSGNADRAVTRYREALALLPGNPAAIEGLARVALGFGADLRAAEALFLKALENGGHLELYLPLIEMAEGAGSREKAARYRRRFLVAARADASTEQLHQRSLALVLGREDRTLEQALRYARRDLAVRRTSETYAVLGWVLGRMGRMGDAWESMEAALTWVSPEPEVDYLSGLVALDAGHLARGRELLSRALTAEAEIGPIKADVIRDRLRRREAGIFVATEHILH